MIDKLIAWIACIAVIGLNIGYFFNSWRYRELQEQVTLAEKKAEIAAKNKDPKLGVCEWKYIPALGYFWLSCGHVFRYEINDSEILKQTVSKVTEYCHLCGCKINII